MNGKLAGAAVCSLIAFGTSAVFATPTLTTLATFTGTANGANPAEAALIADGAGNLYGTTNIGGSSNMGTVFEVAAGTHALSTLATFKGVSNGSRPLAGLLADASGNLYGTTSQLGSGGEGTVFKIAAGSNTFSTLAAFSGLPGGASPDAGLIADASGNLYGTTQSGGSEDLGEVFQIAHGTNAVSTLVSFDGGYDGDYPTAALISDSFGNFYGTTSGGYMGDKGTVFKIAAGTNTLSTLAVFNGTANGAFPYAGLTRDASGNLFGTTYQGGSSNDGTVYKVDAGTNILSTLATFTGTANGSNPSAGVILDASGNLYGTTYSGGSSNDGTVFKITAGTDTLTTLATFTGATNGAGPAAGLFADASGNLYGTTNDGGSSNDGTVFELSGTGFAVPEPGSVALMGLSSLYLLRRQRCRG